MRPFASSQLSIICKSFTLLLPISTTGTCEPQLNIKHSAQFFGVLCGQFHGNMEKEKPIKCTRRNADARRKFIQMHGIKMCARLEWQIIVQWFSQRMISARCPMRTIEWVHLLTGGSFIIRKTLFSCIRFCLFFLFFVFNALVYASIERFASGYLYMNTLNTSLRTTATTFHRLNFIISFEKIVIAEIDGRTRCDARTTRWVAHSLDKNGWKHLRLARLTLTSALCLSCVPATYIITHFHQSHFYQDGAGIVAANYFIIFHGKRMEDE